MKREMAYNIFLIFLCLFGELMTTVDGFNVNTTIPTYAKLKNDILSRDAVVHQMSPLYGSPTSTLNMSFSMMVMDVLDIDQVKQVMTICAYLKITWTQEYLSWEPELYDNLTELRIEIKSLWAPELLALVGYDESTTLELSEWVTVTWMGTVASFFQKYISFRCAIDFKKYPFDTQECKLGILPFVDLERRVVVNNVIIDSTYTSDPYVTAGEWEMTSFVSKVFSDYRNNQSYPQYSIKVRRRPGYNVVTIIFPLVLTSAMISLVFLIPTKTGEKLSFFITLYTSLSIFLNMVSAVMPRNLSSAPYLVLLLVGVLIQGLIANLATLFIVNRYEKEKNKKTSTSSQSLFRKRSDRVVPIEISEDKEPEKIISNTLCEVENTEANQAKMSSWPFCLSSSQWDRAFFLIFSVAEVVFLGALFGGTDWLSDATSVDLSLFI